MYFFKSEFFLFAKRNFIKNYRWLDEDFRKTKLAINIKKVNQTYFLDNTIE